MLMLCVERRLRAQVLGQAVISFLFIYAYAECLYKFEKLIKYINMQIQLFKAMYLYSLT